MAGIALNTNVISQQTNRRLGEITSRLKQSFERLSSGLRINRGADDAAGLAIASSLNTDSRVYNQGIRNPNDGASLTNIAESSLDQLTNIVTRLRELAEQSANGTLGAKQRASLDAEAQALSKEYFRISRSADFNGQRLFDGSLSQFRFQGGYGEAGGLSSNLGGKLGTGELDTAQTSSSAEPRFSRAVALGDLDGDGLLDQASLGEDPDYHAYLTIRLGRGDGSFGSATSYSLGTDYAKQLILADVDNDGRLDAIATTSKFSEGAVNVFHGNADGTFTGPVSYEAQSGIVESLIVADFNSDGLADIAAMGIEMSTAVNVMIRLGRADGTFGAGSTISCSGNSAIAAGDLNGDGKLDLVAAVGGGGTVEALIGDGRGGFTAGSSFNTGLSLQMDALLADLNGDGKLDLAVAGNAIAKPVVLTSFGRGDGTFGPSATTQVGADGVASSLAAADLNGDGALDLISGGRTQDWFGRLSVLLNNERGLFELSSTSLPYGDGLNHFDIYDVQAGDVNGDGVMDVVSSGYLYDTTAFTYEGAVSVFIGKTRQGIAPILPFSLKTKADSLQAIPMLQQTQQRLSSQRGTIGALQSRLSTAVSNLHTARENYDASASRIMDVDVASESALLVRSQILQQAASSILGQANQVPALALSLLR